MQTFAQTTAVGNNPTSGSNRINQQTRPVSCSSVNYKQSSQNNSTNLRFGFNTTNAALHARDICTSSTSSAADSTASTVATTGEVEIRPGVYQGFWTWNGHRIRYLRSGTEGPAVLCIHGFGGNALHWRKNLPELGKTNRVWAIDLLGYGDSDKPDPRQQQPNSIYNFENWSQQCRDFAQQVIGGPVILTCNSVGGIAGLQAAVDDPSIITAVQVINISLRMLHINKQAPWQRPLVKWLQDTLRTTNLGQMFFSAVATPEGVSNVLKQCYANKDAVDDELVDVILTPGLDPRAVHVFLDFISYSGGPLPEQLLEQVKVPVSVVWGEEDPWEKIEWGRDFVKYASVQEFISLPGVGHCPMDEAPHLVNPVILEFIKRHSC